VCRSGHLPIKRSHIEICGICVRGIAPSVGLDIPVWITLLHFSVSAAICAPNCAGLSSNGGRVSSSCLDCRIGQAGVDFAIEPLNDPRGVNPDWAGGMGAQPRLKVSMMIIRPSPISGRRSDLRPREGSRQSQSSPSQGKVSRLRCRKPPPCGRRVGDY
jgi:hypothetical protein